VKNRGRSSVKNVRKIAITRCADINSNNSKKGEIKDREKAYRNNWAGKKKKREGSILESDFDSRF